MTDFTVRTDIVYRPDQGELTPQAFDVFVPDVPSVPGIFIHLHGGGWRAGDKASSRGIPEALARAGVVTVNANYTLTPDAPYPQNIEDVFSLITFLTEHPEALDAGFDGTQPLYIGGASAGGHLSSLAVTKGLAQDRLATVPRAVVSWFAPLDPPSRFLKHRFPEAAYPGGFWSRGAGRPIEDRDPFVSFIGTRDFESVTLREALDGDPRLYLTELDITQLPDFLLLVGSHDSDEIRYSQRTWHHALRSVGARSTLLEVNGADHADTAFEAPALIGAVIGTLQAATTLSTGN